MPKIPSNTNRQKQRLSQGTPATAISTSVARQQGELISEVGGKIANAGLALAAYNKRKKQANRDMLLRRGRIEGMKAAQDAKSTVFRHKPLNEADKRGENLEPNYRINFNERLGEAFEGFSDDDKNILMLGAEGAGLSLRADVVDEARRRHNEYINKAQSYDANVGGQIIRKDPEAIPKLVTIIADNIERTGTYSEAVNKNVAKNQVFNMLQQGTQEYDNVSDYNRALKALDDPEVQKRIYPGQLNTIRNQIIKAKQDFELRQLKKRDEFRKEEKYQREKSFDMAESMLLKEMDEAKTVDARLKVEQKAAKMNAERKLSGPSLNYIRGRRTNVNTDTSLPAVYEISAEVVSGTKTLRQAIEHVKSATGKTIDYKHATQLINRFKDEMEQSKRDPDYAEQMAVARQMIAGEFESLTRSGTGQYLFGADKNRYKSEVDKEAYEIRKTGVGPIKAAEMAVAKMLGTKRTMAIPLLDAASQKSVESLNKAAAKLVKSTRKMKESGKLDEKTKARIKETLLLIKAKAAAMEQQDKFLDLMKGLKEEKKEGK